MSIASKRTRLNIDEVTYTKDTIGGQVPVRLTVKQTWAEVKELTGNRGALLRELQNTQPIEIIIREKSYDITPKNIISYNGNDITIHSITRDFPRRYTTILGWIQE